MSELHATMYFQDKIRHLVTSIFSFQLILSEITQKGYNPTSTLMTDYFEDLSPLEIEFQVEFSFVNQYHKRLTPPQDPLTIDSIKLSNTLGELKSLLKEPNAKNYTELIIEQHSCIGVDNSVPLYHILECGPKPDYYQVPTLLAIVVVIPEYNNGMEGTTSNSPYFTTTENGKPSPGRSMLKFSLSIPDGHGGENEVTLTSQDCIVVDSPLGDHQPYLLLSQSGRDQVSRFTELQNLKVYIDKSYQRSLRGNDQDGVGNNNNNNNNQDALIDNERRWKIIMNFAMKWFIRAPVNTVLHIITQGTLFRAGWLLAYMIPYGYAFEVISQSFPNLFADNSTIYGLFGSLVLMLFVTRRYILVLLKEIIQFDMPVFTRAPLLEFVDWLTTINEYFGNGFTKVCAEVILFLISYEREDLKVDDSEFQDIRGCLMLFYLDKFGGSTSDDFKTWCLKNGSLKKSYKPKFVVTCQLMLQDILLFLITLIPSMFNVYTYVLTKREAAAQKYLRERKEMEDKVRDDMRAVVEVRKAETKVENVTVGEDNNDGI